MVENLGMQNLISVRVKGSELRIRALLPADLAWEGEEVSLSISPQDIHWFDIQSGDRLQTHQSERVRQPIELDPPSNGTVARQRLY